MNASKTDLQMTLLIPARSSAHALENTIHQAHHYFSAKYPKEFEIILVPNGDLSHDRSLEIAQALANQYPEVRVVPHSDPVGKGAALRTGFRASRGNWIFFTDADLPYDLEFFDTAAERLRDGYDLVTGNRRLGSSHFNVPVSLLPLAYGRHRLGLWFNRVVRLLMPIQTTDTQAGIKAMSRRLADLAFSLQQCPGFFFDLELFLTAAGHSYPHCELPVTLYLNSEKSTVRLAKDFFQALYWLIKISLRNRAGCYGTSGSRVRKILSLYENAALGTRFFLKIRWLLTPYRIMSSHLPGTGKILDLGCGHGLLSVTLALESTARNVRAIDHDTTRVALAGNVARTIPNLSFEAGPITIIDQKAEGLYSGIAMIDVMHYFDPNEQEGLMRQAYHLLKKGGTLIVREVDPQGGLISRWNRLYEKIATRSGFTRSQKSNLYFRTRRAWEDALQNVGFAVKSERCSSIAFADILYVCQRHQ